MRTPSPSHASNAPAPTRKGARSRNDAKYVGAHVSAAGGVDKAPERAAGIGANAFALFTKNQKRWESPPIPPETAAAFRRNCEKLGFGPEQIVAHAGYLLNLGHPDPTAWDRSRRAFIDELERCARLGIPALCVHPGAHLGGMNEDACLGRIAEAVNHALDRTRGVTCVIENTAGQGTTVGHRFEHLAAIVERVDQKDRVGVCLDTCHTFAAGYDLRTPEACEETFRVFDRTVGFAYLRAVHLNGSMVELGSRKDRHERLEKGHLGLAVFRAIMTDPRFDRIPMVLETPDPTIWDEEIALLRGMTLTAD